MKPQRLSASTSTRASPAARAPATASSPSSIAPDRSPRALAQPGAGVPQAIDVGRVVSEPQARRRRQRARVVLEGVVGGVHAHGRVAREAVVAERARRVARQLVVPGERGQVILQPRCVPLLDRRRDAGVQARSPHGRQSSVQRLANERVREREAPRLARQLDHHARRHRLLERVDQRLLRDLGHPSELLHVELGPEHGRGRDDGAGVLAQPTEAATDQLADALRHAHLAQHFGG